MPKVQQQIISPIKSPIKNPIETIVLVHGLWEKPFHLKLLGFYLSRYHYDVQYFSYSPIKHNLAENTKLLFDFLKMIKTKKLYLVGHSLGGLLIVELLESYALFNVVRSVIFGSPVNGSAVARAFGKSKLGNKMLGNSHAALCDGVRFLCRHQVGVIAGIGGRGMGQFFADLPKPHDGAVAVSETKLLGATDSLSMELSHFTMLFSTSMVSKIVSFLKVGKFNHDPRFRS